MFVLDSVNCTDAFPQDGSSGGAQIIAQNGSNGGYASVSTHDVYVQLAYMPVDGAGRRTGQIEWTPAVHVGPGNIILAAGTYGIRFRNYVAGQVAVVSAGLSEPQEPALQLTSAGVSAVVGNTSMITGRVDQTGAPQTGSGYTCTHLALGQYRVDFNTPFAGLPTVVATAVQSVGNRAMPQVAGVTVNNTTIWMVDPGAAWPTLLDQGFFFIVSPTT